MTTENHDNETTPTDRPTEGKPAPEPATQAASTDLPAPALTLETMQAFHDRLLKVMARLDQVEKLAGGADEALKTTHAHFASIVTDQILPQLHDLGGIVNEHGDVIEDVVRKLTALVTAAPNRRPDARPLRGTTGASSPGTTGPLGTPLAPGESRETTFTFDPTKTGEQVVPLASGGEMVVNVRKTKPAGAGMIRDGRATMKGTRRG